VNLHELVDILIAVANLGLAAAVIPTVLEGYRRKICSIPLRTSLGRVFFLGVMGVAFVLDSLWFSTACIAGNISIWTALAVQHFQYFHLTVNNAVSENNDA